MDLLLEKLLNEKNFLFKPKKDESLSFFNLTIPQIKNKGLNLEDLQRLYALYEKLVKAIKTDDGEKIVRILDDMRVDRKFKKELFKSAVREAKADVKKVQKTIMKHYMQKLIIKFEAALDNALQNYDGKRIVQLLEKFTQGNTEQQAKILKKAFQRNPELKESKIVDAMLKYLANRKLNEKAIIKRKFF